VFASGFDFGDEFEFGLDLILDGIEQALRVGRTAVAGGENRIGK